MRSYLKRTTIFFGALALVPFLTGLIAAFSVVFFFFALIFGLPVVALTLLIGTVVWLIDGVREAKQVTERRQQVIAVLASPLLCAATVALAFPMMAAGGRTGTFARFVLNYRHYEAIIESAQAERETGRYLTDRGITYIVDPGPPVRVAFHPEGFLDNWSGTIFDPTGEVMQARGWDKSGKFAAPDRITKLFGGDLVACRRLWGDYYSCSFT